MSSPSRATWTEKARFCLVLALISLCFLWGGGSRLDIPGLIFLQPLAILVGFAVIIVPGEMRWAAVRLPLVLLAALALIMVVQLIPLPPSLWTALPGHARLLPALETAGIGEVWRPLSLTPDATLASLVGLGVPAAALVGLAGLPEEKSHRLLPYLLIAAAASALFGLAQLAGGPNSAFYRYAVTNAGAAVGLFSNRNHQAVFLAMIWPMLALWMTRSGLNAQQRNLRQWIAWTGAVALIPLVTATGSRAGLILNLLGMALAWWWLRGEHHRSGRKSGLPEWARKALPAAIALAAVAMIGAAYLLSRAEAIQRLFEGNVGEDSRLSYLPVLLRIAADFLPFGSGFGSFDPVYRFYEPEEQLDSTYLNHAHNDLVELVITGGLPALALLLLFLFWAVRRGLTLRGRLHGSSRDRFAFLGLAMIGVLLLASLADYPLRTPIHAMLLAFAAGWAASSSRISAREPAG